MITKQRERLYRKVIERFGEYRSDGQKLSITDIDDIFMTQFKKAREDMEDKDCKNVFIHGLGIFGLRRNGYSKAREAFFEIKDRNELTFPQLMDVVNPHLYKNIKKMREKNEES